MSLVLEIEFLTGVYRASTGVASETPDWPPQPDRVFSALVAAWGSGGETAEGRAALEWLEEQAPPTIHASGYEGRTAPEVFVPPNDMRSSRASRTYLRMLPDRRPRQPRRFPTVRPHDPVMHLVWEADPPAPTLGHLQALARDVTYVGHSASLVRCLFAGGRDVARDAAPARTRIYRGRLRELRDAHAANPVRPLIPATPANVAPAIGDLRSTTASTGLRTPLVLECLSDVPDLRAAAILCRMLRRALMSGYRQTLGAAEVPAEVSGHRPDGAPGRDEHLAIQPLAFVGHPHADGRIMGFALITAAGSDLLDSRAFRRAFRAVARFDEARERRVLELGGEPLSVPVLLSPNTGESPVRSLQFDPYVAPARVWASATPVVLDRHLKGGGDEEERELVALACEYAGLPRPATEAIQVGRHSALAGAPAARPGARGPAWSSWRVPRSLATRPIVHVTVAFEEPVGGPVLLGAGRFTGLGLLRGIGH